LPEIIDEIILKKGLKKRMKSFRAKPRWVRKVSFQNGFISGGRGLELLLVTSLYVARVCGGRRKNVSTTRKSLTGLNYERISACYRGSAADARPGPMKPFFQDKTRVVAG
jgi:hypothetical protein